MNKLNQTYVVVCLCGLMAWSSVFFVQESERAITSRLGQLIAKDSNSQICSFSFDSDRFNTAELKKLDCQPVVLKPGIHFKWPFIDSVRVFDSRLMMLVFSASERIPTIEKKDVMVDLYVKWKIEDFGLFYVRAAGDKYRAETLLKQKIINDLRAAFGQLTIKELVSGERNNETNEKIKESLTLAAEQAAPLFSGREGVMKQLKTEAHLSAKSLGIQVLDVRIKQINFPIEVSEAVYQRMRTERARAAVELRAKGKKQAEFILAKAEKEKTILLATAQNKAQSIRGEGDAQAMQTYAESVAKSPEFFEFYRSQQAYVNAFANERNLIITDSENEFFKYFKKPRP